MSIAHTMAGTTSEWSRLVERSAPKAAMLGARDRGSAAHGHDVVHLCDAIADELGIYGNDRAELLAAAQRHEIGTVDVSPDVARFVRHSHERWDGTGYPDGLSGEQIPLPSRIVSCADTFHAIRSSRHGRSAQSALAEVQRVAGSQLDPQIADALVRVGHRLRIALCLGADGLASTLRSRRLVELLV